MKFMLIVKATPESETGAMPGREMIEAMGKYNREMMDAGVWVEGNGLKASSLGARINISGSKRSVVHGPFTETNELIAGYWIIDVASLDEAIDWAKRSPDPHPGRDNYIEIRPFFDPSVFE